MDLVDMPGSFNIVESAAMEDKAVGFFKGRYNCAQAVSKAFQEKHQIPDEVISAQAKAGGGRAEGGLCGALHGALELVDSPAEVAEIKKAFESATGALTCREVRKLKQVTCRDCVAIAARALADINRRQKI